MKSLFRAALAIAVIAIFSMTTQSEASAQNITTSYNAGYGAGLGFGFANGNPTFTRSRQRRFARQNNRRGFGFGVPFNFGGGLLERSEDLPYFAKFPPVYYSGKVKRPYGVSPYAAPPGITPVEMNAAPPVAQKVTNPFFKESMEPETEVKKITVGTELEDKSTYVPNPYIDSQVNN